MTQQRSAEELAQALDRAKAVRTLVDHPGWQVVDRILQEGIENARSRVMADDCDMDEVRALRGVVRWMRRLRETPRISDADIQKWEGELAFRQKQEKMRADLGLGVRRDKPQEAP